MAVSVTLVSVSAFARLHGVSKAAAQKWEAKGYLTKREGKVWVEGSDRSLEHAGLGRFAQVAGGGHPAAATGNQVAATATPGDDEPAADPELELEYSPARADEVIRRLLSGEVLGIAEALQAKENGLALRQLVRARRDADAVIEIEHAERVLFEQGRAARDAWLNWPARAGPPIAAKLGLQADAVVEVLTAHVHEQLAALGEPEADFSV